MNKELVLELKNEFEKRYGISPKEVFFAPGRVNLIGEHTDYNGGHVFPCALSMGTYGMISPRQDNILRLYSLNLPENGVVEVSLDELKPGRTSLWSQYPEGVFWTFMLKNFEITHGADLMYAGDVPAGSGLSSSASIEVLTGLMIRETYGFADVTGVDLAKYGQYSENEYNGCKCGIMDQFSSAMGREAHAIYLDTNTLEYDLVPLVLGDCELIITNSNVKHSLVSSAYNDRRRECAQALAELKAVPALTNISNLCDLNSLQFEIYGKNIKSPVDYKRAKHAISENERANDAVVALQHNDLASFGKMMNASHVSLRDDYEVSCDECDYLAECAWEIPGVLGSRITGGGFGGCTISIVKKKSVDHFIDSIGQKYYEKFGHEASFYRAMPEDGAHVIKL